jgi:hypothetical protein
VVEEKVMAKKVTETTVQLTEVSEKSKVVRFGVDDEDDRTNAYIGKQHLKGLSFENGVEITIRPL